MPELFVAIFSRPGYGQYNHVGFSIPDVPWVLEIRGPQGGPYLFDPEKKYAEDDQTFLKHIRVTDLEDDEVDQVHQICAAHPIPEEPTGNWDCQSWVEGVLDTLLEEVIISQVEYDETRDGYRDDFGPREHWRACPTLLIHCRISQRCI
jgi:hypothetical protein